MPALLQDFHYAVNRRDSSIFRRQRLNYDARNCLWKHQSEDGRKWTADNGKDPFPWPGSSDARVRLTELYINQDVAVCMVAYRRMRTVVSGTELNDFGQANRLTNVLRWMKYTQIKESFDEHEYFANILFETGCAVMKTVWCRQFQLGREVIDLETLRGFAMQTEAAGGLMELGENDEKLIDLPSLVMDPNTEAAAAEALAVLYPDVRKNKLRQVVSGLREEGAAEIIRPYLVTDRPVLRALVPNQDVFISPEATDINQAQIHERELLTETQLREKVRSHAWDKKFVEEMLKTQKGRVSLEPGSMLMRGAGGVFMGSLQTERLFEVVHTTRRQADEDGVPGIFYTCFSPGLPKLHALHSLLAYDHGEVPYIHTSREKRSRLLDESRGYGEIASTWQSQIKTEWDSRIDRSSIATLPPSYHPPGEPPDAWGPGVQVPTDRSDDYGFMEAPRYDVGSREVEESVRDFADEYFGRPHPEKINIYADALRQHMINRFLSGCVNVDVQMLQLMQQYMRDEFYFRIVGDAKGKPIRATREEIQGKFDVSITFDIENLDPERKAEKIDLMQKAIQMDTSGRVDRDEAMTILFELIDPSMGERLLRAPQDASQAEIDDEDSAFAKIFAGLNVDIRPGQAFQLRAQRLQSIMQTNPLAQLRYQRDEQFKEAVDRRLEQFNFQMQQQENAVTGRFLGTQTQEAMQMEKALPAPKQ